MVRQSGQIETMVWDPIAFVIANPTIVQLPNSSSPYLARRSLMRSRLRGED
jgi:hypothetical protein